MSNRSEASGFIVSLIKEALSIEEALASYGGITIKPLKRKVNNIHCPFHQDNSPSFSVWENGRWKCWAGCGHGDVINLVSKLKGLDNASTIAFLAKELGFAKEVPTAASYDEYKKNKMLVRGFHRTKKEIRERLIHSKVLITKAKGQVKTIDQLEVLKDAYDFEPYIDWYLADLDSPDLQKQIETIEYLTPILLEEEWFNEC